MVKKQGGVTGLVSEAAQRPSAWPSPGVPALVCGPGPPSQAGSDGPGTARRAGAAQLGWDLKNSVAVKGQEPGEYRPPHSMCGC